MSNSNWRGHRHKRHKVHVRIGCGMIIALVVFLSVMVVIINPSVIFPAHTSNQFKSPTRTIIKVNPGPKPTVSVGPTAVSTVSPTPSGTTYVTLSSQNFIYNTTVIHPYGSTMYPYWRYNGVPHKGGNWINIGFKSYIDQIINMAQNLHLNTIRTTNYFDDITYGDWYNAMVWSNMDYLFQQAALRHMYVLLDLSSFRDKTLKQGIYPYDPTLYTTAFSWVASRYAHNPALLNYAIAGEIKCPTSHDPLRPTSTQALTEYYRVLSDTLFKVDPNHLISAGGLSYLNESNCGIDWQSIFSLPHISIAAIHVYSDNDRNITIPMVSQWATQNQKPFTIEEFGFRQGDSDTTRASEFQNMYNLGKQYNATTMIFWNLGPEISSTSYEVNPNTPLTWKTILQNAL